MIGLVARCSKGRPGLIVSRKELPWGESWVGIGLDDGSRWASTNPEIMSYTELVELMDNWKPVQLSAEAQDICKNCLWKSI